MRDDDHADQRMLLIDRRARIFQFLKVADDLIQTDTPRLHRSLSPRALLSWKILRGTYHKNHPGADSAQIAKSTYSARWPCVPVASNVT